MTSVVAGSGSGSGGELDERLVAKAALEAAEEQLRSLCASNAGVFVSVERRGVTLEKCLSELQTSVKEGEPKVSHAYQSLDHHPDEDESTGKETSSSSSSLAVLSERHRVRRRTLLQHSSLLELLELPLMDACVRSNLYDEALSIAAFANTLERRHGAIVDHHIEEEKEESQHEGETSTSVSSSVIVVARVISQIRSRQFDLRRHLLHRLKGHVTMPQCLEVVTALRRLNSIDLERQGSSSNNTVDTNLERIHDAQELRLMVDFLEARDAWLDSAVVQQVTVGGGPTSNSNRRGNHATARHGPASAEHLLDSIERYRTRCFEIATQFLAIFRASPSMSTTSTPGGSMQKKDSSPFSAASSPVSLLSVWTTRRIHSFLTMLSSQLTRMEDSASLRDALEACVFFATSMGRLGADFTAQLAPLFEPKMLSLVLNYWAEGVAGLAETLKVCRDAGVASPLISNTTSSDDLGVDNTTITSTASHWSNGGGIGKNLPPPPPRQLLALPPLARLVNSFLTGLNELRRCLFPGIFPALRKSLHDELESIRHILQTNERAVMTPGLRGEATQLREAAARMMTVFADVVEPYLEAALEVAIGDYDTARTLLQKTVVVEEPSPELTEEVNDEDAEVGVREDNEAGDPEDKEAGDPEDNVAPEDSTALDAQEEVAGTTEESQVQDDVAGATENLDVHEYVNEEEEGGEESIYA